MTLPRCSIIVPVHNKAGLTRRCLESILAAPMETPYEILVVDDASTDSTPELLAGFGVAVRRVTLPAKSGFAAACNAGAAAALSSDFVLFLNNDTVASAGWLDALVRYADAHPAAAVVGAKLVYPEGTVQHAGVVICRDGMPRHLYQGFPGDHPAVNHARVFQAVTGACMLVRREAFERAAGFDPEYRNCLEDIDLCLRLRELGTEIHYCHESVLVHYESATRGRRSMEFDEAVRLYRSRWLETAHPDDLDYYVEDGLLRLSYPGAYPLRMTLAPELAVLPDGRADEVEHLFERAMRQVFDLLLETVRLSVESQDAIGFDTLAPVDRSSLPAELLERARKIELEIADLQREVEHRGGPAASSYLNYRKAGEDVRSTVAELTQPEASVLVVSRGDDALLELPGRHGHHFPQGEDGLYSGFYPATDDEAIAHLEEMRSSGAQYLVFPPAAGWWLEHYTGFARHLTDRYTLVANGSCAVYSLEGANAH